ncbi:hypothetical protein [Micromonospora robiginosa]|uniref:Uncharacterized protein n=1 Tax=Micromonospora robiginosa TaxID=2749844 RepID=A0A7L6B7K4_9ACTN|nr:hypothetical protein [Micromonospora ferruginea]QLQ37952.1 hypothetical protein H1D33_03400 [Micromonospora ferruginea]
MTQQETTNRRPIETLTAGEHVSDSQGVHEIVHVLGMQDGGAREITLTLRPLGPGKPWLMRHPEGTPVWAATSAEVREYEDQGRRRALAELLHKLADDIVEHQLPLPSYHFTVSPGHFSTQADVERWATYLGAEVGTSRAAPDIAVTSASRPITDRLSLDIRVQGNADPVVEPAVGAELAAKVQAEADALPAEPEHYHAAGAGGEAGACAAVCACGVTFAGFDSIAEAVVELDKHIANPDPEQDWYFTFGSGQQHDGKYVVIAGTYDSARARMLEVFGNRWSHQYASAEAAGVYEFGMALLPEAEWPKPVCVNLLDGDKPCSNPPATGAIFCAQCIASGRDADELPQSAGE